MIPPLAVNNPELSIHAISAPKRTRDRAMCLEGPIDSIPILVFIDSGADQNFLNPAIATRLALPILVIIVANGQRYYTKGIVHDETISF